MLDQNQLEAKPQKDRMLGNILVTGIACMGRHGANPIERESPQQIIVDVIMEVDLAAASRTDSLEDTVNYAAIYDKVIGIVRNTSFTLMERLAAEIATEVLHDSRIASVEVAVSKPQLLEGATPKVRLNVPRGAYLRSLHYARLESEAKP